MPQFSTLTHSVKLRIKINAIQFTNYILIIIIIPCRTCRDPSKHITCYFQYVVGSSHFRKDIVSPQFFALFNTKVIQEFLRQYTFVCDLPGSYMDFS